MFKGLANHLSVGQRGEKIAVREIQRMGLEILQKNFSVHKVGEIDIIARDGSCLVFVEVKTRSKKGVSRAGEAVGREKRLKIWQTAKLYFKKIENDNLRFRFDVIEVYLTGRWSSDVRYLVNAYDQESY